MRTVKETRFTMRESYLADRLTIFIVKKRKLRYISLSTRSPGRTFGHYNYGGQLNGILA